MHERGGPQEQLASFPRSSNNGHGRWVTHAALADAGAVEEAVACQQSPAPLRSGRRSAWVQPAATSTPPLSPAGGQPAAEVTGNA